MNILLDISHPAHINFFKHAVRKLSEDGNKILITGLKRGKLPNILETELNNYEIRYVGSHNNTLSSIIFNANIKKFFNLLSIILVHRIDIGIGVASFVLGSAMKLWGKPNLQFDDDPERSKKTFLEKLTCTELFYPYFVEPQGKIKIMKALKEWAYLSPKYFKAQKRLLNRYDLIPKRYIFIREASTGTLNYRNQSPNIIVTFADKLPANYKVLLSLEDKRAINKYPCNWIILEEPIEDIHSLIYYSKIVISSGDSMAREGAMLGVPSIYCGTREMGANRIMINKGMLYKINPKKVPTFVSKLIAGNIVCEDQNAFRLMLQDEWDDITQFIFREVKKYEKK